MLKFLAISTFVASGAMTGAAFAEGDAAAGETAFGKCKACHAITDGDTVIVRGGRTGPDLFGIIGTTAGAAEGFRYGDSTIAAGAAGLVWDVENVAEYVVDPTAYLRAFLGDTSARSKMTYRERRNGEDIAAYLASLSPAAE